MVKKLYKFILFISLLFALTVFIATIFYILIKAFSVISVNLLSSYLLSPAIGTMLLVVLSVAVATPIGVATAIYLNCYSKGIIKSFMAFWFDVLASIPSILIGLFGFSVILALHNVYPNIRGSLLSSSLFLSLLILPYIVKATTLGIKEINSHYTSITLSLGASKEQLIKHTLLPLAKEHIFKGIVLSIARSAEDTAVIMLTGVVASYGLPGSLTEPYEALPFFIYTTTATYSNMQELNAIFVASAILITISIVAIYTANSLKGKLWLK